MAINYPDFVSRPEFKAWFAPGGKPRVFPLPEQETLAKLRNLLAGGLSAALDRFQRVNTTRPAYDKEAADNALDVLFGPRWEGHALRFYPLFWACPMTEPNATKMLSMVCTEGFSGSKAKVHCKTLSRALLKVLSKYGETTAGYEDAEFTLHSEVGAPAEGGMKYIDLLFRTSGEAKPKILIEAKFGAPYDNPFDVYEQYIKDAGDGEYLLVLLGCDPPQINLPNWRFIHWWELLRAWEEELSEDNRFEPDQDCSRLRRSLWDKMLQHQ